MSPSRPHPFLLLVLLLSPWLLGARGCSQDSTSLKPLPPEAPLRFEHYGSATEGLHGPEHALALMAHPAHREAVFSQALERAPAALLFWSQMEAMCQGSGKEVAQEHASTSCTVIPPELGCELDTSLLHTLIPGEQAGGQRLRQLFLESYAAEWERQRPGFRVKANLVRGTLLLGVAVVSARGAGGPGKGGGAPVAGGRLDAAQVRAAAEGRAVAAETAAARESATGAAARTRASVVESSAMRARPGAQRLLAADSLGPAVAPEVLEALETRLLALEAEVPALGRQTAVLERLAELRPSLSAPPASVPAHSALWRDYVAYWQRRFSEMEGASRSRRPPPEPPLYWEAYTLLRNRFQAGIEFQRTVTQWMREEAALPAPRRTLFQNQRSPRVEDNVGLRPAAHEGLTYVDQLVVDEASLAPGLTPRVESYSCKLRSFHGWDEKQLRAQVLTDAKEALARYGGEVQVRRPTHPLFGRTVRVSKVHLVYKAEGVGSLQGKIREIMEDVSVEVHFR